MRDALNSLFTDTVLHEPVVGRNLHGMPTYGASVSLAARVIRRQRTVVGKLSQPNQVAISRAQVQFRDAVSIDYGDRLTLPDGTTAPILAIDALPDETGAIFVKVYL